MYGCSGGGDLALEVAAATEVFAIMPEEPASVLMTGVLYAKSPKQGARFTPADAAPIVDNPKRYYTPEQQKFSRAKIDRIHCPILIIQGDVQPLNRFNAETLIPELRAAGKSLEVITYPGEPHCFCFNGSRPRMAQPEAALKAFHDMDTFCRRHVPTKPKSIDASLVRMLPIMPA